MKASRYTTQQIKALVKPEEIAMLRKAMAATIVYSTAVIYQNNSYFLKNPEVGSGTFVIIKGKKGILTNYHVALFFIEKNAKRITVPFTDAKSKSLEFQEIISLSYQEGDNYPDIAFIVLKNPFADEWVEIMRQLGKKFFDLDKPKPEYDAENYQGGIWLINGNVYEGKKIINNRQTIYLRNAGSYVGVPYYNGTKKYKNARLGEIEIDTIDFPINVADRSCLPSSFEGMSGAALWKIDFNWDAGVESIKLIGLATIQDRKNDKLVCQGPVALYKTFIGIV